MEGVLDHPAPTGEIARRSSLGDDVYEALLARLISLKIAPGSRINIDTMARELGVSQTPIRAALVRLESEGLVVKTHLVGYSAASLPSAQRLREINEMRILLEPFAAERAAERMTAEAGRELAELARRIEEPESTDRKVAYSQTARLDALFHDRIFRIGGCELIAETIARLQVHTHLFRVMHRLSVRQDAIAEHRKLLEALLAGRPKDAREAMEEHVTNAFARVAPLVETLD